MSSTLFDKSIAGTAHEAVAFITNILESSTEYAMIGTDSSGHIVLWNEGARRIYGYDSQEVVGQAKIDLLHTPQDIAIGKPREILEVALRESKWEGPLSHLRKNGETFTVHAVVTPRFGTSGQADGFLLISKIATPMRDEAALRQREERLRAIFNTEPECVKVVSREGHLLEMNPAGLAMIQADSVEEVRQKPLFEYLVPEHRAAYLDLHRRVMAGENGVLELEVIGLKGRRLWLEMHATPLRDEKGEITSVLDITRDITERKQAEAIVACRTAVLQMIAKGAPLTETLTLMLRHMEAFAPGMIGSILLLDADGLHLRHGAAPNLPEAFNLAIDGEPIGPRAGSCGTAAFRREQVIVEDIATDSLWDNYRAAALPHGLRACWSTPIFGEHQQLLGTFAIYYREPGLPTELHQQCIDLATNMAAIVLSRHRDEAALSVSESRYHRLEESGIVGVMIANTDGRISEANDLFLRTVGYTRDDLKAGRVRWDTMPPPEWREVDDYILENLKSTGSCPPVEKEYIHKDGRRVPILATVALLEGTPGDCICLINNITERKQAEAALAHQVQWNDTLLDTMVDGFILADLEGVICRVNASYCATVGRMAEELVGMNIRDLEAALNPEEVRLRIKGFQRDGWARFETSHRHKNGGEVNLMVSLTLFSQGEETQVAAFVRDITERKQAEAALRASEARYRTLFEYAPDGIVIADSKSYYLDANQSICQMLGYPRDELIGLHALDIVSNTEIDNIEPALNAIKAKTDYHREWQFRRKDGSFFEADVIATLMPDGNLMAMIRDITERKRMVAALRTSQEHLTAIMNSVDGIVWEVDAATFRFTFVSPRAERLLGYPLAEWTENPTFWSEHIHPDDREYALNYCRQCTRAKRDHEFEYRMLAADGRFVWLRDIVTVIVEDNEPVKLRGIMMDITERKKAEAALRESEASYRTLIESASDSIFISDTQGRITDANAVGCQMFGYTREELLALSAADIIAEGEMARIAPEMALLKAGEVVRSEWLCRRKDGTLFPGEVNATILPDGRLLGILRDITQRKQAEEELAAAARQMRALAQRLESVQEEQRGNIARELHDDLGQTLSVLKINLTTLFQDLPSESAKTNDTLRQRIEPLQELVDSSIQSVRRICLELRPRVLDDLGLAAAIEWQVFEFKKHTGIRCRLVSEIEDLKIESQRTTTLFRILQEALTNVARHAEATRVKVRVCHRNGLLVLEVQDNGRGITPEDMAKTTSLGLLGIHERALLLGGDVVIQRNADKGTTVRAQIPLDPS